MGLYGVKNSSRTEVAASLCCQWAKARRLSSSRRSLRFSSDCAAALGWRAAKVCQKLKDSGEIKILKWWSIGTKFNPFCVPFCLLPCYSKEWNCLITITVLGKSNTVPSPQNSHGSTKRLSMSHSPTCLVGAWIHPKHATYGNFKTFQTNKFYWLLWKTTKIKFPTSSLVSPLLLLKSPHLSQAKRWKISCKGANQHGSIDRGSAPWLQPLQHQHRPLPGSSTAWQKLVARM